MFRPRSRPVAGGVPGTAQVVSITPYEGAAEFHPAQMSLRVSAQNLTPTSVQFDGPIHRQLWPTVGATLPVSVNPNDPTKFAVLWDQVASSRDPATAAMQGFQDAMSFEPTLKAMMSAAGSNVQVVGDVSKITPEQLEKLKSIGTDLGALAGGANTFSVTSGADDRVGALERLAALRDKGALTEAEFQAEKARILAS